ncbi:MAG: hypothetical protein A4E28_00264 [Methanocella sp. PtaU1.Bin125]|nr:MAG: hypothetical protein A4E28_00264 [Methanocella sp. PtaU1.Bin125]
MASLKINLIEFGVSIAFLAAFIALFAIAGDIAGEWSNFAYLGILLAFTIAICLFGWKLAPYLYDHFS